MENIVIRSGTTNDVATILHLGRVTFSETFAESNTEADLKKYLDENFTQERVASELSNVHSLFFIAWEGEDAVGYLKVNAGTAQTELQDAAALEIERIYMLKSHHSQKAGQILFEKALEVARQQHKSYIWLGVWEENVRAIRFYEKNGFVAFDKHVFKMGNDAQVDIMMRKSV